MPRRLLPLLLLVAGCQAGGSPTEPDWPNLGDPYEDEQRLLTWGPVLTTATLNGSEVTDPEWVTSPLVIEGDGVAGEVALFQYRPTSVPASDHVYRARFRGATTSYGFINADQSSGWDYIPVYLTKTEKVQLRLFNAETDWSPLYPEAVTFNTHLRILPVEDGAEPNDDDNPLTTSDASLASTISDWSEINRTLFVREAGVHQDIEDWFRVPITAGLPYRFLSRRNSNGQWGRWDYDIRVFVGGQVVAQALNMTGWTAQGYFTAPASGFAYIQVVGRPQTRRGASIYYFQYSLRFSVPTPLVLDVAPTGALGLPLDPVTFTASVDSPVTSYNWQFDGGTIPATSTAASPEVLLSGSGTYSGVLTVSNGARTSAAFPFAFQVDYPTPPEWAIHEVESTGSVGKWNHAVVLDDRLAVVYGDLTGGPNSQLKIARALVDAPVTSGDWNVHAIDPTAGTGWDPRVIVSGGRLAVSYLDSNLKQLRFARATVAAPSGPGDWSVHVVDPIVQDRQFTALAAPSGQFALAWYNRSGDQQWVAIAEGAEPAQASDWGVYPLESLQMGGGGGIVLLEDGSRLLCVYPEEFPNFDLRCAVATVASPPDASAWTIYALDSAEAVGEYPSGAWHDGTPALAYFNRTTEKVRVARGVLALPLAPGDWQIHDVAPAGDVGGTTSVAVAQGRLAVGFAHKRDGTFKVARATAVWPVDAEDWQVRTIDSSGSVGWYCSLVALDDALIASYEYATNTSLQVARALEPW